MLESHDNLNEASDKLSQLGRAYKGKKEAEDEELKKTVIAGFFFLGILIVFFGLVTWSWGVALVFLGAVLLLMSVTGAKLLKEDD